MTIAHFKSYTMTVALSAIFTFSGIAAFAQSPIAGSAAKLQAIQKIIDDYQKAGEHLADPDVKKSILGEVAKLMPLDAKGKLDTRDAKKLADEANVIASKKFPESEASITKIAEKEASDIFIMANIKDNVSVQYKKGNYLYTVQGTFYGIFGNTIKVGDKTIAIIDIIPESQAKFDKETNDGKRREYVNAKLQDHATKKKMAAIEALSQLKELQTKNNENNGFILAWKDWRTARGIVDMLLSSMTSGESNSNTSQETTPAPTKTEPTPAKTETTPPKPEPTPAKTEPVPPPKTEPVQAPAPQPTPAQVNVPNQEYYENLKRKIDAKLAEISNSCSGIDSDQGYKSALWGLSREDVGLILSVEGVKVIQEKESTNIDYIRPKDGPIKEVELYYIANTLVKVSVYFTIADQEGATTLRDALIEKYGLTDEQRKALKEAEEEKKLDKAEKAADGKKKKEDGDKKAEPEPIPLELSYHWTGKITTASVYFKANGTRSAFDEIKLTKMDPILMKKLNDEERRAKEEAIKELHKVDKKKLDF